MSWQSSSLTRREAATVRANWQEFTAFLPVPGVQWRWGESGLSERVKHYLHHHDLIVKVGDSRWETTESLWMWVISNAGPGEEIGARAVGQEQLPVDAGAAATESRVIGSTQHQSRGSGRQQTLGGSEVVNRETQEHMQRNVSKGETDPSRAAQARADDAQATLTGSGKSREDWVGPTSRRSCSLSRAARGVRVYAGQEPLVIVPEITGISG